MRDIKNSSGKIIGNTDIQDYVIYICNSTKPVLIIDNTSDIEQIKQQNREDWFIIHLYDDYYLNNGEIASLYNVCYSNMNKQIKTLPVKTKPKEGRRNRSYGKQQSDETKEKISKKINEMYENGTLHIEPYERTSEIKQKISNSLKEYFKEHPQNPEPHRQNWVNGVYDNVDFHIGIGGTFFSIKNNSQINFRSLLELAFMLILETNEKVKTYTYEPIHIKCENGSIYTPDICINNNTIIELKSKKYVETVDGVKEKVEYKKQQCIEYCLKNNYDYKMIFDTDIAFDSSRMKRHLAYHPEVIEKYNIIFNQPERMVIK